MCAPGNLTSPVACVPQVTRTLFPAFGRLWAVETDGKAALVAGLHWELFPFHPCPLVVLRPGQSLSQSQWARRERRTWFVPQPDLARSVHAL